MIKKISKIILITFTIITGTISNSLLVYAQNTPKNGYHIDKYFNVVPDDPKANKKIVLLTIDDGPSKNSKALVDLLQKRNIKAIFFVNGIHSNANKGTVALVNVSGFAIGNHTWSHANLSKINETAAKREIDEDTKLIQKETGKAPRFFRPPYGVGTKYVQDYVKKNNMIYMNWSGAVKDWEKTAHNQKVYINNVTKNIHNGEIILIHEHSWSVPYVDTLITTLSGMGYTFIDPNLIN